MNEAKEQQATPGPWKARLGMPTVAVYAGDMKICDIRGWGHLTGAGAMNLPFEEAEAIQDANARLIAAAPELRDACCAAARHLEDMEESVNIDAEVLFQLNDAVARATLPGIDVLLPGIDALPAREESESR